MAPLSRSNEVSRTAHVDVTGLCLLAWASARVCNPRRPYWGIVSFDHVWTRRLLQALLDDGKWSARMYPACLEGSLGMPAASMRFAHLVLNNLAARLFSRHEKQDPEMLV